MTYIDQFLFGFYPYLCMVSFFLGSWARFDRSQYTWRAQSSQLLRRKQLMWGSILFHVGILGLFFGHFVGLLTPEAVLGLTGLSVRAHQMLAIIADAPLTHFRRVLDKLIADEQAGAAAAPLATPASATAPAPTTPAADRAGTQH